MPGGYYNPIGTTSIVWFYLSRYLGDFQNCCREKIIKNVSKTALSAKAIFDIVIVKNVMADKFLESAETDELREVIGMTRLGQMLVNKGIEQGKLEIAQKLIGLLDDQTIAEKTELPLKTVLELKEKKESVPMV